MNNEIKINVPEGMEIDKENSTFECIKFKPKWVPKKGDIATTEGPFPQVILVKNYIKPAECVGFKVIGLAVLSTSSNSLSLEEKTLWVKQEASASEKEMFIRELNERGYIYDPNDPRVIYKKERKLPKTWEEFCIKNPINQREYFIRTDSTLSPTNPSYRDSIIDANVLPSREYAEAMLALCKLIQLRDCYNDGWEPDWNNGVTKYAIVYRSNKAEFADVLRYNFILNFKTKELRDEFYNNFKNLIEQAKLLL